MDKDLEELKVKAQQMLKKCREDDLSVENLPDVRKSLNNLLNDIKSVQQLMKENCRMPKYFILARKES